MKRFLSVIGHIEEGSDAKSLLQAMSDLVDTNSLTLFANGLIEKAEEKNRARNWFQIVLTW